MHSTTLSSRLRQARSSQILKHPDREQGFSLVEVLVSVIILSFGLLGMVGLQAAALQANREARLQSSATALARELAEMMRGNKDMGLLSSKNPYFGNFISPLAPATTSYCLNVASSTACGTPIDTADAEMTEWLTRVDNELPGASVTVCNDSSPFDSNGLPQWICEQTNLGDTAVIKIGWTKGSTDKSLKNGKALERATIPSIVFTITPGNT